MIFGYKLVLSGLGFLEFNNQLSNEQRFRSSFHSRLSDLAFCHCFEIVEITTKSYQQFSWIGLLNIT